MFYLLYCFQIYAFSKGTEEECLDFRRLKHLEVVDLSWNSLGGLPATLEDCPTLKHLDVSYNKLKFLPDSLQSSEVLETLILDGNSLDGLQRLPPWFNHLKRIEHMSLVGVWVFDLIGPLAKINFDQLTCLDLENSSLIEIPVALLGILTLETLRIKTVVGLDRDGAGGGGRLTRARTGSRGVGRVFLSQIREIGKQLYLPLLPFLFPKMFFLIL